MILKRILGFLAIGFFVFACKNDDDQDTIEAAPPRPLSEVAAEDDAKIQEYLKTHYYNYDEFETPSDSFNYRMVVRTIPEGNDSLIPLLDQAEKKIVNLSSSSLNLEGEESVPHTIYYIEARGGVGASPTEVDSVFLRYRGVTIRF